jgi:alkylation response protein AidB-like acyl-CoA dehydrogenase
MDFDFSAEQDALREAVRTTLADHLGPEQTRALVDASLPGVSVPRELWDTFVELGWTGLLVPEAQGGLGLGLIDLVLVLEEMGQVPLPGPFLASAGFATRAAVLLEDEDLLSRLASGEVVGSVGFEELATSGDPLGGIQTRATRSGDGWVLDGLKPLVLDGHLADVVIVVARDDEGLAGYLVQDAGCEQVASMDPTRSLARLELVSRPARRLGPAGDQSALWRRWAEDGAVMLCAEMVGACDRVFALSGDYAKVRVQFGRPIGTFQAVKHIAAEMLQDLTLARVGVHYAAWTSDSDAADREVACAMAKAWTGEAAVRVTGNAIQIHGGVGFTWDALVHLHYKRAKVNDLLLGRQGWQRSRVADLLLGPAPALV